ncbi:hypothetical protein DY130_04755 [Apilactobacillus micheneri]|uniref:DUF5776 domain-containing protein n=1 Tax=Apilactobacillus micheneri TaxID=1899430 RepID=A0A9Q8IN92_9LACO|nr:DUF5776 domain-containing protein [Apilactobacillus micheneri]TPR39824.1 hypothetical protein DY121_04760 [Apilactobacillus micheneri]TPR43745.1 hypothetical protein DY130_04755 [Apilactobacillus micheneri]
MQYNKQQFNKVNDKKIMKKVKKQWVVVSVASLAVLGGFAVSGTLNMNQPSVVAHADTPQGGAQPQPVSDGDSSGQPSTTNGDSKSTNSDNNKVNSDYQNGKQATNNDNQSQQYNNNSKGFNDKLNNKTDDQTKDNSDYKAGQSLATQYQDAIRDGASDVANNTDNSGKYTDQTSKQYYDDSNQGAKAAKTKYNTDTSNKGTSDKDYTSYNNTVQNKNDNDTDNSKDNKTASGNQADPTDKSNNYNNQTGVPTGNSDTYDSTNKSGGADNPDSASQSTQNYDKYLKNKFNGTSNGTSTNYSVQNGTVNVPSDSSVSATNSSNISTQNGRTLNGVDADIYAYGYNYFLANQAALDYESGKWKGTTYDSQKGSKTDSDTYLDNHPDNNSSYYNGYMGAQKAIVQQWPSDTSVNRTISNNSDSTNDSFNIGYNDALNKINSGTMFVSNGQQFDTAMNNDSKDSSNIRLINDIDLYQVSDPIYGKINQTESRVNMNNKNVKSINIDGQNHIADLAGVEYDSKGTNISSLNINNFKTIYGGGYYGPFGFTDGAKVDGRIVNYNNINYVGVQLLSAQNTDATFSGNNNITLVQYYNSPFHNKVYTNNLDQENLEVSNMTLKPGSNYFGDTDFAKGTEMIGVYNGGKVTLGQNSNMTLMPGNGNQAIDIRSGSGKPSLNINKGANLNIVPDKNNSGYAISNAGSINVDGGVLNVEYSGNTGNNLISNSGSINIYNNGLLQTKLNNSSNTTSLISGNGIYVYKQGNVIISDLSNDSANRSLISGSMNVDNAGPRGIVLNKNSGSSSYFATNGIYGSNVSVPSFTPEGSNNADDKNKKLDNWFYTFNVNGNNQYQYRNTDHNTTSENGGPNTWASLTGNNLRMSSIPTIDFIGKDMYLTKNSDGSITINGIANVKNASNDANPLTIEASTDHTDNTASDVPDYDKLVNKNVAKTNIDNANSDGPYKFTVNIPKDKANNANVFGLRLTYGISGNNMVAFVDNQGDVVKYSNTIDNSKVAYPTNVSNSDVINGMNNGISDSQSSSSDAKNDSLFDNSVDYKNSYDSTQAGYDYYKNNNKQDNDINGTAIDKAKSDNNIIPSSFVRGYQKAKYDASSAEGTSDYMNSHRSKQSQSDLSKDYDYNDYSNSYDSTQLGYESGQANNTANRDAAKDKDAYDRGHSAGQGSYDALHGNPMNSASITPDSNKSIYTDAYNNTVKGYQEGLSGNNASTNNRNENDGNSAASSVKDGYKQAIDDYNAGSRDATAHPDKKGYQQAMQGLIDGASGNTDNGKNSPYNSYAPIYEIARSQALGAKNGISDAKSGSTSGSTTPTDAGSIYDASYQNAYNGSKDGYNNGQNNGKYNNDQANNPVYTNAFDQGEQQRGADDYLNGSNSTSTDSKKDNSEGKNYSTGANAAKDGLNDAKNKNLTDPESKTSIDNETKNHSDAYKDAYTKGVYANKGYQDATSDNDGSKAPTLSGDKSNQAEVDAYWGAQAGANTGKSYSDNPANSAPNTNSQFYKDAEQRAQQDIANGAQDYINDKSQGKTGDQLKPSEANKNDPLYTQGYNNQKAYDEGFNNPNGSNDGKSQSYIDGQAAAKSGSSFNNVKDGKNNSTIDGNYENNGALQGFNDAKSGAQFDPSKGMTDSKGNSLTGKDATNYQGAYAKAYAEATDQMNKGAQQYSSDKNNGIPTNTKPTDSSAGNQDAQSFNQGYDNQKAYDAGLNDKSGNDDVPSDYSNNASSYKAGKNASKSLPTNSGNNSPMSGAATDANNSDPTKTDNRPKDDSSSQQASENAKKSQDAYDGAKAGYVDGSNGSPANSNVGKSSDYQQAYNKAYGDMQKSRQDGTNDFFDQTKGNSLNNPSVINGKHSSDNNNGIGDKAHNNAFAEQKGYAAGLATNPSTYGDDNNPYKNDSDKGNADSNFNAYKNGFNNASAASAGYKAAQSKSNPSVSDSPITGSDGKDITDPTSQEAYRAAAQAFADAKANKPSDNSGKDSNYKNAYNMAYNQNRAAMGEGENDALGKDGGNTNIPNGQYPSDITTPSAKALYDEAKGNASQGYADAMKPSNANNANAPEGSSKEYTDGYNQAKSISAGANAAIAGAKQAPTASGSQNQDQVNAGFNAAQQAIKNGLADAQSGKNKPNNGKFDENQIFSGAKDVPSTARQAYIDAYEGAYNGYNNGLNGGSQKPSSDKDAKYGNDTTYSAAYDNAFKQGQNDIPAPTPTPAPNNDKDDQAAGTKAGQQAFAGGTPLNINHVNFAGKSQAYKDAFTKGYNDSQAGFNAGLNGGKNNSDNPSFKAGYQSAQAYKQGVKDATRGKKPAKNSSDAYKVGYEAYKAGISGKKANRATLDKLAPAYRKAYEKNYQAAHKAYVAVSGKASKAARKNAFGTKRVPRGLKHESPAYQAAYMEAFNRYVKDNLPSYVYNLKKVYSHNAPALTRSTRVKKYGKTALYNRHVFKVTGYKITSSGHVVYRVKGLGWISASDKSVNNVYYRRHDTKKPIQKVRVIKPQGTYIYNSKSFNKKTAVKKMKKGSTVNVERIERVGGITRFYIGNGQYISSNKTIVEHVR